MSTSGADLPASIADLRHDLDLLADRADALAAACRRADGVDRLAVVEGPFAGDADAALSTAHLWLDRARVMLSSPARSLAQAHVAAGGLAER